MKFNTRFSDGAHATPFKFKKDSMTQQEYGYCLDINNIIEGCYNPFAKDPKEVVYGMTQVSPDKFMEGMYLIADAKSKFAELPSKIRERFDNNPGKLLEFVSNEKNYEEGVSLGIFEPKVPPTPVTVEPTVTQTESGVSGA